MWIQKTIDGALYNEAQNELIYCPNGKTNITISDSVTSIRDDAFNGCKPLKIYCVRGSVADTYTKYPNGSEKIYGDGPLPGDADNNGKIEANDAALVLQKVLTDERVTLEDVATNAFELLDADKDGQLTARDATYILQKALDSTFLMPNEK